MSKSKTLNHTEWECCYHVVFIPKYRRKAIYGQIRRDLGDVFRDLARRKQSEVVEGHVASDHVHMLTAVGRGQGHARLAQPAHPEALRARPALGR